MFSSCNLTDERCEYFYSFEEGDFNFFKYQLNDTHYFSNKSGKRYFLVYESFNDSNYSYSDENTIYFECENDREYYNHLNKTYYFSSNIPSRTMDSNTYIYRSTDHNKPVIIRIAGDYFAFDFDGKSNTIYCDSILPNGACKIDSHTSDKSFIYYCLDKGIELIFNGNDTLYHE